MAAVTLEFPDTKEKFTIDCVESFSINNGGEISKYPVEKGSRVADHRERNPVTLTIAGVVSNVHPGREFGPVNPEATGYHTEFLNRLGEAEENSEMLVVNAGKRGIFTNMMIADLSINWDSASGFSIPFSLTVEELTIVETETINLMKVKGELGSAGAKLVADTKVKQRWQPTRNLGNISPLTIKEGDPLADLAAKASAGALTGAPTNWAR